jgi:hypothetical protein
MQALLLISCAAEERQRSQDAIAAVLAALALDWQVRIVLLDAARDWAVDAQGLTAKALKSFEFYGAEQVALLVESATDSISALQPLLPSELAKWLAWAERVLHL